jgi:hypothetical protein
MAGGRKRSSRELWAIAATPRPPSRTQMRARGLRLRPRPRSTRTHSVRAAPALPEKAQRVPHVAGGLRSGEGDHQFGPTALSPTSRLPADRCAPPAPFQRCMVRSVLGCNENAAYLRPGVSDSSYPFPVSNVCMGPWGNEADQLRGVFSAYWFLLPSAMAEAKFPGREVAACVCVCKGHSA